MASRTEHYREAERLLAESRHSTYANDLVAKAQVHAILACVGDGVYVAEHREHAARLEKVETGFIDAVQKAADA